MKEKLAKLIDVKSLVTITLTGVFAYLSAAGRVAVDQFLTVFTVIIAFYFGTQAQKRADRSAPEPPQAEGVAAVGFDIGEEGGS